MCDQLDVGGKREGGAEEGADVSSLDSRVGSEAITTARNTGPQVILKNINHRAVPGKPQRLLTYVGLFALLFNFLPFSLADRLSAVTSCFCQCACF